MKYVILFSTILFMGCPVAPVEPVQIVHEIETYDEDQVQQLVLVFMNASKEDNLEMYKYYKGMALFVDHAPVDTTTGSAWSAMFATQDKYSWARKKNMGISTEVRNILQENGIGADETPSKPLLETKENLIKTFNTLAEAAKRVYEL